MTDEAPRPIDEGVIFQAELEEIRRRRSQLGLETGSLGDGPPSAQRELNGLAFSGGGIRSACVMLGVSQALSRHKRLSRFDYLSTVSGGGYLGGCLSSLLGTPPAEPDAPPLTLDSDGFPFRLGEGTAEPDALSHLRSFANYLVPDGSIGRVRLAAVLVRGVVLNAFLLLPWLLIGVILTEINLELESRFGLTHLASSFTLWIIAATLTLMFTFPFVVHFARGRFSWVWRNRQEKILAVALALSLVAMLMLPFNLMVHAAVRDSWDAVRRDTAWALRLLDSPSFWLVTCLALIGWSGLRAHFAWAATVTAMAGRAALFLLGPTILVVTYLLLCARMVHPPFVAEEYHRDVARAVTDSIQHGLIPGGIRLRIEQRLQEDGAVLSGKAALTTIPGQPGWWIRDSIVDDARRRGWLTRPPDGPLGDANVRLFPVSYKTLSDGRLRVTGTLSAYPEPRDFVLLGVLFVLALISATMVDVNVTSLHPFYRDRLSRAFLLARGQRGLTHNDSQRLSDLNASGVMPYHLINATINVSASTNPSARGRNADFFLFSRHFTGSSSTGYCTTGAMENADRRFDLAGAIAISGAAAGPRMGVSTDAPAVGDLTLFNIRLGYWLPNPCRVAAGDRLYGVSGPGPTYLLRESFGFLHERGRYVNVSDGGHIENLGVYQLLRRRCKLIVAVDAASDPAMRCESVAALIRYARIDLGVVIDINLDQMHAVSDGITTSHWALGKIYYGSGDDDVGDLIYLKSSLTGDENEVLAAFRRQHPAFPQQTTADQFFDEVHFEVYRALGDHLATRALNDTGEVGRLLREMGPASVAGATPT